MTRSLLLIALVTAVAQAAQPIPPAAAPPPTDIYELTFDGSAAALATAKTQPIVVERGYDNQPFYTPDGQSILYTAIRDGTQTDIYEFDRASRKSRPLIATPEGEYSPTITPDGRGISVIRVDADKTQRLWRFDRAGGAPAVVMADIKPVGYHTWVDGDQLVLFVLGPPATLQLARVSTGKAETLARDIGRSLQRIPGGRLVSFVIREASSGGGTPSANAEYWVNALNPQTGAITALTRAAPGSADRDCAWLSDGTLLMSAGTKIWAWKAGDKSWREAFDGAPAGLGTITRMAVAPDGKAMAIVVNEAAR
jgi:dipeptidyl aminopeptidase/acylaminoacyl peptidase